MRVQELHKLPTPTSKARPHGEHSRTSARSMVKGEAEVRLGWSVGSKTPTWTKPDSSIRVPGEHHYGDLTSFPRISGAYSPNPKVPPQKQMEGGGDGRFLTCSLFLCEESC